jgi:pyruvate kinase
MLQQNVALADRLIAPVAELRRKALELEQQNHEQIKHLDPGYRESARNLLHYLAMRQTDIRQLQRDLTSLGLHSLGGIEAYTLSALEAVLVALHDLADRPLPEVESHEPPVNFRTGPMLLNDNSRLLLGAPSGKRTVRIMVTMPSEAATDPQLVRDLLASGMDVMRINCAHDDADAWLKMIRNLRLAENELGRQCKIYADLAGPKLRTGDILPAGQVLVYRPRRDIRGRVLTPAYLWLTPAPNPAPPAQQVDAILPIEGEPLHLSQPGDIIELIDTRDQLREMEITAAMGNSRLARSDKTTYLETGTLIRLKRDGQILAEGAIGPLPEVVEPLLLAAGDKLVLTREDELGRPAAINETGQVIDYARIPCTLEAVFDMVKPGERVLFDDGKIGGRILTNNGREIVVEITRTGAAGAKLRPEKGINLPDSTLTMPALTNKDLTDLEFLVKYVDIVGLSFVRTADDVGFLDDQLYRLGAAHIGVVLKIENNQAFQNLPQLLLKGLSKPPFGIMVARGDLAAEVGFERLAEVQEEILWLCEAAHVPVIWATQVLESLARRGSPSRAEVSDAVLSSRAECVMLNKGPYIVETVRFLAGVLERMSAHFSKQRARLRRLSISEGI